VVDEGGGREGKRELESLGGAGRPLAWLPDPGTENGCIAGACDFLEADAGLHGVGAIPLACALGLPEELGNTGKLSTGAADVLAAALATRSSILLVDC